MRSDNGTLSDCGERNDTWLIRPDRGLRDELLAMAEEFGAEGNERFAEAVADFESYFVREAWSAGDALPEGHVPWSAFWLVQGGRKLIGRSSLRHCLNPRLEHEGGHIGYGIRPSERRKGYGTRILALTLKEARKLGLRRVLVTCDADNVGSRLIIERNGGMLENKVISERAGKVVLRFWIDLIACQ